MHKKFIIGAAALIAAALFVFLSAQKTAQTPSGIETATTTVSSSSAPVIQESPPVSGEAEQLNIGRATLKVNGEAYSIDATPRGTVINAMNQLVASGELSYTSKNFPGLGVFVDSINGKKSGGGMQWILYVNGTLATQGAGTLEITEGDVIEWKYEKEF